ncbi:MAG: GAF domain-containing protein [Methanobacteriaceae archaeon]|nr:GAF domain-containing protein [Methanobacteriaceae archaeon]
MNVDGDAENLFLKKQDNIKTGLSELRGNIQEMINYSSLKEISDYVLQEATRLTQSKHCYVAYVDPENKDSVGVSFSHLTEECQYYADLGEARFKVRKDGTYGGLLGYSLDTGESFYVHDIESHPAAHGLPEGHMPVNQFLSVPVTYENSILGQIVLGNPKEDYNDTHLKIVNEIADIYAHVLKKLIY